MQASIGANTYVITGAAENKKLQDLLPGIINQVLEPRLCACLCVRLRPCERSHALFFVRPSASL